MKGIKLNDSEPDESINSKLPKYKKYSTSTIISMINTIIPRIIPAIHIFLNLLQDESSFEYFLRPIIPKINAGIRAPQIPNIKERIAKTGLGLGEAVAC